MSFCGIFRFHLVQLVKSELDVVNILVDHVVKKWGHVVENDHDADEG